MSDLVGNPDCWFSRAKAQIILQVAVLNQNMNWPNVTFGKGIRHSLSDVLNNAKSLMNQNCNTLRPIYPLV